MANCGKEILINEGTNQQQRFIDALDPASVRLNDFGLKEWMKFAYGFAEHIYFFETSDFENPAGNWQEFFKTEDLVDDFVENIETLLDESMAEDVDLKRNITPHLALYVCFIKILELTQERFNRLTKKHLDFYYQQVLQIEKLPATADKVHLIFELAKKSNDQQIEAKTQLDGGKDDAGTKRIYETNEELIANKAQVVQLKSVYNDHANKKIKAADVANSYDGLGEDFPDDEILWWPFGYYIPAIDPELSDETPDYPELTDAKVGFALSANILELQEGERNIQVTVEFKDAVPEFSFDEISENLVVYCSGEEVWLGPFTLLEIINDEDNIQIYKTHLDTGNKTLMLAFQIPKDEEAIVNYNPEILGENLSTEDPVCRFLLKTENDAGHNLYRGLLDSEIKNISIDIDVRGVESLLLENDNSSLNAGKPFYPFGTIPVKGSKFYIDYPELFKKNWVKMDVEIEWKNTPETFTDLYFAYRTDYLYKISPNGFVTNMLTKVGNTFVLDDSPSNLIVESDAYFEIDVEILEKEDWGEADLESESDATIDLFGDGPVDEIYTTKVAVLNQNLEAGKNGPIRLSLKQSFLHELFARIYALALVSDEENALIPNEPYTPYVEKISLNYKASSSTSFDITEALEGIKLFHEHPFGQSEEHPYLKTALDFLDDEAAKMFLVPFYCKGGELYIGLENAVAEQTISLLVQVLEGSENPEAESFEGKQKVEWSLMCSNEWKSLNSSYIISNDTDNFLKSGIIKFSIPKEATFDNTRLPAGMVWIKAKIHKNFDAVGKAIVILAQAVEATFSNNNNDLSHLDKGLEAETISKMVNRLASVKSVSQPFNSFGGVPEESDANYYRRISERLRHKNRAINTWDYEHLILQNFPEIHKVKCINHTHTWLVDDVKKTSYLAPGNVLLVVIPDIINKNVFDIFKPRVGKSTLNSIQEFINKLNSLHVNAKVVNPEYEEVRVELNAKFYKGLDENFYKNKLNTDIINLLSPWAFDNTAGISFGRTVHISVVVNYIENLDYVDFVSDVKLKQKKSADTEFYDVTSAVASCPESILVSAKTHIVGTNIIACAVTNEPEEKCQK